MHLWHLTNTLSQTGAHVPRRVLQRSKCETKESFPEPGAVPCTTHGCTTRLLQAVKRQRTFNSGVMLLSGAHRPMLDQWEKEPLR